jgi:hypothetical protein
MAIIAVIAGQRKSRLGCLQGALGGSVGVEVKLSDRVSDPTHRFDLWWAWVDFNHQPRPYQEADLRHMFVRIIGFPTARTIEGSFCWIACAALCT